MLLDRMKLDGQVALVSGGGRGIGRAIALALAEAGAAVAVAARTEEEIEATAEDARALGAQALAVVCDANHADQLEATVARTREALGPVGVLVNVAGGSLPCPAMNTTAGELEQSFHFNVTSAFVLTQQVVPQMRSLGGGAVVNISSALSHLVESGFVSYGTAKAALSHMTRLLAYEFAPRIRVNAIAAGAIETDALRPFLAADGLRDKMEAMTPMARLGTPDDVALAALYLASPASSWVTGKVLEIDGGTVASNWPFHMPAFGEQG